MLSCVVPAAQLRHHDQALIDQEVDVIRRQDEPVTGRHGMGRQEMVGHTDRTEYLAMCIGKAGKA
jgi:hypothetical protein